MLSLLTSLALIVVTITTALAAPDLQSLFGPSLSSGAKIYTSNFTEVTPRWTLHEAPTYFGAIKPATEADIQNIVKIATKNNIPFLATGGGYGDSITFGRLDNGLEIDLSLMKSIKVDAANNRITVGGGSRFDQVLEPLYFAGKEMAVGTATCVSIVGTTLGGGVSSLQGLHGLLIDTLKSVRVVTASGQALTASKTINSDLFWAIRGAGANYGIISSATYEIFDFTNNGDVLITDFEYYGYMNGSIWNFLKSFDDNLPANLALNIGVRYDPVSSSVGLLVNSNYFGPNADGLKILQPLMDFKPVLSNVQVVPWTHVVNSSYFALDTGACRYNQYVNAYTVAARKTNVSTLTQFFDDFSDFQYSQPTVSASFVLHRWPNNAVLAVPDSDTSYPYRDIKSHYQIEFYYAPNDTISKAVDEFSIKARKQLASTSGYGTLATYTNFAHGDEGPAVQHGKNKLQRLISLKRKWDPKQVFSFNNPIPVA